MTDAARQFDDELTIDDELAAKLDRLGLPGYKAGERLRLHRAAKRKFTPEQQAVWDSYVGSYKGPAPSDLAERSDDYYAEALAADYEQDQAERAGS